MDDGLHSQHVLEDSVVVAQERVHVVKCIISCVRGLGTGFIDVEYRWRTQIGSWGETKMGTHCHKLVRGRLRYTYAFQAQCLVLWTGPGILRDRRKLRGLMIAHREMRQGAQ